MNVLATLAVGLVFTLQIVPGQGQKSPTQDSSGAISKPAPAVKLYKVGTSPTERVHLIDPKGELIRIWSLPSMKQQISYELWKSSLGEAWMKWQRYISSPECQSATPQQRDQERKKLYQGLPRSFPGLLAEVQSGVAVSVLGGANDIDDPVLGTLWVRVKMLNGLDKGKVGFVPKRHVTVD